MQSKIKKFKKSPRLTISEIDYILENRETLRPSKIANDIGRPSQTVRSYLKRKGLSSYCSLSIEDKQYIYDNHHKMFHRDIADDIGVTKAIVSNFCQKNKLYKNGYVIPEANDPDTPYVRPDNVQELFDKYNNKQVKDSWIFANLSENPKTADND